MEMDPLEEWEWMVMDDGEAGPSKGEQKKEPVVWVLLLI